MAASKAEYLKRYMSDSHSDTGSVKKKKKRRPVKTARKDGFKIFDEDVGLLSLQADTGIADDDDENPTVAEVIDERPEDIKRMEQYTASKKWKGLGSSDGANKEEDQKYVDERENLNEVSQSKIQESSPSYQQQERDESPPRKKRHNSDQSPPRRRRHDSDQLPPRRKRHDSDQSPARGKRHDSDQSPPRRKGHDSDQSPPRRKRHDSDQSPPRRKRHDSDQSPPRRKRHDSDQSPPRRKGHDSDQSPPRQKRHDSDQLPPRRKRHDSDQSPARGKRHDSDQSPARRKRHDSNQSPARRKRPDSDQSPARRKRHDSDQSPPRRKHIEQNDSNLHKKTLAGKIAGLSSATEMRAEADKLRKKEAEMFSKIEDNMLGKNAETIFRDKTGRKRDLKAEQEADLAKKTEINDKYDKWSKGLIQGKAEEVRITDMAYEMNKPLARAKDDADLDEYLKEQDREGDPMLKFLKKKKDSKSKAPKYPTYNGPAPDPNRFGIRPGYRWDGVDRGNGFEKKYFQTISNRKAVASDAYKWSTEDM